LYSFHILSDCFPIVYTVIIIIIICLFFFIK
jgi:hypothetical protein